VLGSATFVGDAEIFFMKLFLVFFMIRVFRDAVYRADLDTLGNIEMAHAFGTQIGFDDIDFLSLGDRPVGTLRFTDIAINTFIGNYQSHT